MLYFISSVHTTCMYNNDDIIYICDVYYKIKYEIKIQHKIDDPNWKIPSLSIKLNENIYTDRLQGNMKSKAVCWTDIAHRNKFGHASGGRGGGRPAAVSGGHPNGDSTTIPLFAAAAGAAAGAANVHHNNNNHRNHSGSNRNYNCVEVVTLAFTILACLLLRQDI